MVLSTTALVGLDLKLLGENMRSGKINWIGVIIFLLLAFAGIFIWTFGPYYWDSQKMDSIVRMTVMTWQDLGEMKARKKLDDELYNQDIPDYITPNDCKFTQIGQEYTVSCSWYVEVAWPFTNIYRRMEFERSVTRDPRGFLD